MTTLVISGNPRPGSRTLALARRHADQTLGGSHRVLELSAIADQILVGGPALEEALAAARAADQLVVATPSYKGSLTGLLKAFLDQLPSGELTGGTAHPVVVAGSPAHVQRTTEHLVGVLDELGLTVAEGVGRTESDLKAELADAEVAR